MKTSDAKLPSWLLAIRFPLLLAVHVFVFSIAFVLAYLLRFDFAIPEEYQRSLLVGLPIAVSFQIGCFLIFRTFNGWWRYVTFRDLISFVKPLLVSFALVWAINYLLAKPIPRSVLIMHLLASGVLISLVRSSWRLSQEGKWLLNRLDRQRNATRAFIISNHHDTLVLANQINSQPHSSTEIVGILTIDKIKPGSERAGIPIVGHPDEAPQLADRHGATQVWLVAGSIAGPELAELKKKYDAAGLKTKVIPAATDRNPGGSFIPVREIDINDLLRRAPIELDTDSIEDELTGKCILVTGAGGSIGSEICRQLVKFQPSRLLLVDHRENSVFLIHGELSRQASHGAELIPAVGDILDRDRMENLFQEHRPDFVYHAAAHKHVGLMEVSPGEAIKNNILGTKQIADLADQFGVTKFVMVSTDKAVNPTSVMGCTKHIAERYVMALGSESKTRFVAVRFGNVLGSNGSVVPIFKDQISRGGPITVTDPEMTRYFMTIPEASQLVIQSGVMGQGGEIFVLDMGEPVKIVDLAVKMIELAGLPADAIDIEFVGARPGEKMYEELYFDEEQTVPTPHQKVFAAKHRKFGLEQVIDCIERLNSASPAEVRDRLLEFIPEYRHPNFKKRHPIHARPGGPQRHQNNSPLVVAPPLPATHQWLWESRHPT